MKNKGFSSLRTELIITFIAITSLTIVCLSIFSFQHYRKELVSNTEQRAKELVSTIESGIDSYLNEYSNITSNALLSENIHLVLQPTSATGLSQAERQTIFENYYNDVLGYRKNVQNVYAVSLDGLVFTSTGISIKLDQPITEYAWYQEAQNANGAFMISSGQSWVFSSYENKASCITVARLMKKVVPSASVSTHIPLGVLAIEISPNFLTNLLSGSISGNSHLVISGSDGCILYDSLNPCKSNYVTDIYPNYVFFAGAPTISEKNRSNVFTYAHQMDCGWSLFMCIDLSDTIKIAVQFMQPLLIFAVAVLSAIILMSLLLTNTIVRPIHKIQDHMKLHQSGDLPRKIGGRFPTELSGVVESYNILLDDLERLISENYLVKIENLESQYKSLQAQMNPHFIYNVLEIICCQMTIENHSEIAKTVRGLAKLLRYNLNNASRLITLKDEVEIIENYCNLLREVYQNFGSVTFDLPKSFEHHTIPTFILQPIVENAVIHGFRSIDYLGYIKITIHEDGDDLLVIVWDNGCGIPYNQLVDIKSTLYGSGKNTASNHTSIGLFNVHRRLMLKYGIRYGVKVESEEGSFTRVTLRVPKMTNTSF